MKHDVVDEHYLARSFSVTSFSRVLGVGTGVVLDALILFYFGLSRETDAYFAALAIPALIGSTLEIQIPKVLIPFCAKTFKNGEWASATRVLSNFMGICSITLISLSMMIVGLISILIPILVPGFQGDVVNLAVKLGMILSWIMVLQGVGATFQSILLSHHKYGLVSSTKFAGNFVAILVLSIFHQDMGIYALAFGVLAGCGASFLTTLSATISLGFRYRVSWNLRDEQLLNMFRGLLYPLSGHALGECKALIENFLLSFLGGGSLSALRYASKIVEALVGITVGSISTSTLPLVSHYAAEKNVEMMKASILKSIKLSLIIAAPLSIWLILNGESVVLLLFGRGKFSPENAVIIGSLMSLLAPYIVLGRMSSIMQAMFYATNDTRTPSLSAVVNILVTTMVAFLGIESVGIYAFPIATSAGAVCTAIVMAMLLDRKFGGLGWRKLESFCVQFSGVLVVTALVLFMSAIVRTYVPVDTFIERLVVVAVPTALGGIVFVIASLTLGLIQRQSWAWILGPGRVL
jgi:putative peptidoglycan lipid II flippase